MAKVLDNNQTNMQTAEGSSLPPLPYTDNTAAPQLPIHSSIGFIIVIVLFLIIVLFSAIKFSKALKTVKQEKVTDIISHTPEKPKEVPQIENMQKEPSLNAQKPPIKEEKVQQKISFATPTSLDKCIKKFLEITKNK